MSWSHEQVITLIELYKEKPCLYQVKSTQYKNKHMRVKAYKAIENQLINIRPGTSVAEIKGKINGLRTNFLTEHCKHLKSIKSGAGEDSVYKPTLWYYSYMGFILEHVTARTSVESLTETTEKYSQLLDEDDNEVSEMFVDEDTNEFYNIDENITIRIENDNENLSDGSTRSAVITPKSTKKVDGNFKNKRKRNNSNDDLLTAANQAMSSIATALEGKKQTMNADVIEKPDDFEIFGDFVVSRLRMLKDEKLAEAEERITHVLFDTYKKSKQ